ncbi:MAG: chromosome partitioning protein ParB [Thiohalocapsa sp.]
MKSRHAIRESAVAAFTLTALVMMQSPAMAADCKGMEKNKCESNGSCTWVDSYQRKDGVKVDGYCRAKGGKKSGNKSGG